MCYAGIYASIPGHSHVLPACGCIYSHGNIYRDINLYAGAHRHGVRYRVVAHAHTDAQRDGHADQPV